MALSEDQFEITPTCGVLECYNYKGGTTTKEYWESVFNQYNVCSKGGLRMWAGAVSGSVGKDPNNPPSCEEITTWASGFLSPWTTDKYQIMYQEPAHIPIGFKRVLASSWELEACKDTRNNDDFSGYYDLNNNYVPLTCNGLWADISPVWWSSHNYWRVGVTADVVVEIWDILDEPWICPDCTTLVNGYCIEDRTLFGCEVLCNECIAIENLNNDNCQENQYFRFTRNALESDPTCDYVNDDILIFLSYTGSTIGITNAPSRVTLKSGESHVDILVQINDTSDGRLNIDMAVKYV